MTISQLVNQIAKLANDIVKQQNEIDKLNLAQTMAYASDRVSVIAGHERSMRNDFDQLSRDVEKLRDLLK